MTRLPWSAYLAHPGINWSRLKHMLDSAAHYRYHANNPTPETAQKALGRYVHAAVLDPEHLADDFAIWDGDRRGNAYKDFAAAHADKTIMRAADLDDANGMIEAIRAHPDVRHLLDGATCEHTIEWTDPTTGLLCKARPDLINGPILADLKTTRSTDIRRFGSDIARFVYHGQMAHYAHGIEVLTGKAPEQVVLIAVESGPPYDIGVFEFDPAPLKLGLELRDGLLFTLKQCIETDTWPGRHTGRVLLDQSNLPDWVFGGSPADDITDSHEGVF